MSQAPILAIHGAGGGAWEWTLWRRVLGARLHAMDLQPAHDGLEATTLDDYRDQVVSVYRGVGARAMIGASLGGLLALHAAQEVGSERLVLVNPAVPDTNPDGGCADGIRSWTRSAAVSTLRALPDADWYAARAAIARWRDESAAVLADRRPCPPPVCPTLVIAAGGDRTVPVEDQRRWATLVGADLRTVEGASHLGPLLGASAARCARWAGEFLAFEPVG